MYLKRKARARDGSQTPSGASPSGIEGVSQTVAPQTPSQDGASQITKTQLGVFQQESPDQCQAQSDTKEVEPTQLEDISSEGELPDSSILELLLLRSYWSGELN